MDLFLPFRYITDAPIKTSTFRFFALMLSLMEINNTIGFTSISISPIVLTGIMCITVFYSLINTNTKFSFLYISFLCYVPISLIINNPPVVFKSWERFFLFMILLLCVSPVFTNFKIRYFRINVLLYFLTFISIISTVSFLCYFLGINYFRNIYGVTDYYSNGGLFGGLFKHSMLLGPLSGLSTCYIFWLYLRTRKKIFLIISCMTIGAVLFSASRGALASTILGVIILIFSVAQKLGKSMKIILIIVAVSGCTYPLWESAMSGIVYKQHVNVGRGEYGSRTEKFNARIMEFKSSPITGVGFSAIDPKTGDEYSSRTGQIEPGSSWLGALSMTGIIGFIYVLSMVLTALRHTRQSTSIFAPLLTSLVAFYCIHLMFEGYIFAAGGPLCFIYWLTIGVATDLEY